MRARQKAKKSSQYSFFFEFYELEKFPRTDWLILFENPDKYATSIEEAHPRKIQQCQSCGAAIYPERDKAWALKTGGKNYYRYYSYLCKCCFNNAPKIVAIWKEMGEPRYPLCFASQDDKDKFKQFRTRLTEEGLVRFATQDGLLRFWRQTPSIGKVESSSATGKIKA